MIRKLSIIGILLYLLFLNYQVITLEKNLVNLNSKVCHTDSECENFDYSY